MTGTQESPKLHHVVFAVAQERLTEVAQMYTGLGFKLQPLQLTELGLVGHLDWEGGIEIISPIPEATSEVATLVADFLDRHGDGVYTVVIHVPEAAAAEKVTHNHGAVPRFRQRFDGDGFFLTEIDLSVLSMPITLLATNVPMINTTGDAPDSTRRS